MGLACHAELSKEHNCGLMTLRSSSLCEQGPYRWKQEMITTAMRAAMQRRRMGSLWSRGVTSLMLRLRPLRLRP